MKGIGVLFLPVVIVCALIGLLIVQPIKLGLNWVQMFFDMEGQI